MPHTQKSRQAYRRRSIMPFTPDSIANPVKQLDPSTIRVAVLLDRRDPDLLAFYRKAYGTSDEANSGADELDRCPFASASRMPVVVIYAGDEIVAHLGTIPGEFWSRDCSAGLPAHWLKGFMVLEEYRNGPFGYLLVKQMMNEVGLSGVMTVAPAARRLFQAVGYQDLGPVANHLAILRPTNVLRAIDADRLGVTLPGALRSAAKLASRVPLRWIAGATVGAGTLLLEAANRLASLRLRTRTVAASPASHQVDLVWEQMRPHLKLSPARCGSYVAWRYPAGYEFVEARRGGTLAGLAVVRHPRRLNDPRLAGLRVGLLVDLIVSPTDTAAVRAILLGVRRWGRAAGLDAVLLTIPHRGVRHIATLAGYIKVPGNVHFMLRSASGVETPQTLEECWLTRGDAWGDDI